MRNNNADVSLSDVCPRCKNSTQYHAFVSRDGVFIKTHRCRKHGDVVPIRLATRPQELRPEPVDWARA